MKISTTLAMEMIHDEINLRAINDLICANKVFMHRLLTGRYNFTDIVVVGSNAILMAN